MRYIGARVAALAALLGLALAGSTVAFGAGLDVSPNRLTVLGGEIASPAFLVADGVDDAVYVYGDDWGWMETWALDQANADPSGVAMVGSAVYVADRVDRRVYKYSSDGSLLATSRALEATGSSATVTPAGIAVDGTELWLVDDRATGRDRLLKYALADAFGTQPAALKAGPTDTHVDNVDSSGLGIDASHVFVADRTDDKIYRYSRTALTSSAVSRTLRVVGTGATQVGALQGSAVVGSAIWVVDGVDGSTADSVAYRYVNDTTLFGSGSINAAGSAPLASGNDDPEGL